MDNVATRLWIDALFLYWCGIDPSTLSAMSKTISVNCDCTPKKRSRDQTLFFRKNWTCIRETGRSGNGQQIRCLCNHTNFRDDRGTLAFCSGMSSIGIKLLQPTLITGSSKCPVLPLVLCQPITTMVFRLSRDHTITALCNYAEAEVVNLKKGIRVSLF